VSGRRIALAVAVGLVGLLPAAAEPPRPNILLIVADDLG